MPDPSSTSASGTKAISAITVGIDVLSVSTAISSMRPAAMSPRERKNQNAMTEDTSRKVPGWVRGENSL